MPEVGKKYYRVSHAKGRVVQVTSVNDGWVNATVLHGPGALKKKGYRCKEKNFHWHVVPDDWGDDYSKLDGCRIFPTYMVLGHKGDPIFRCSEKRAKHYLKKGFVFQVDENTLQFTNDTTEKVLEKLYEGKFSEFFMAVKNDKCVCCGKVHGLSRHHVIPQRHKDKLPIYWRRCLSNVLFLCLECHMKYEQAVEPEFSCDGDWESFVYGWKNHFIEVLNPQYMPSGWDIISVKNMEAADELALRTENHQHTEEGTVSG